MGSAWAVHACPPGTDHWAQAQPCPHSAPHSLRLSFLKLTQHSKRGWIWKVLSVSIYFLFETLGILTFIIRSPFMAPIRKNKFIYTDFIFNKEIRYHYSVHMKRRQGLRRPSSVSAGKISGRRTQVRAGGGTVGRGGQSPQLLMLCY